MIMPNVVPLIGNHELMAWEGLRLLVKEITESTIAELNDDVIQRLSGWLINGGDTTIEEFRRLSKAEQRELLEFLGEFRSYEELEVNGVTYVLAHAGLGSPEEFDAERTLKDYTLEELVWDRCDYEMEYFRDKILVTGHTPTQTIVNHDNPGYVYKKNNHMAIDCGACFGGRLAAVCLDTGEEFYVDAECIL